MNKYDEYIKFKTSLLEQIGILAESFEALGLKTQAYHLRGKQDRVNANTFNVMVMGNYNTGKSTFVNALVGEEILPTDILPCTAVVNEIKYGTEKKAIVHFKNPLPSKFATLSSIKAKSYLERYNNEIPPLKISLTDLKEFVQIENPEDISDGAELETPIDKVEIFLPLDLCSKGVTLVDTPGLEDHSTRTNIVYNYFKNADVVLFLMNAYPAPTKESEMGVIDRVIRGGGHEFIFFICNRMDMVSSRDRDRLQTFIRTRLKNKTRLEENGIHFISAINALDGKLDSDIDLFKQSGLERLEAYLADFLTNQKGKVKLAKEAKECSSLAHPIIEEKIPFRKRLLLQDSKKLEDNYLAVKPRLDLLEKEVNRITNRLQDRIRQMQPTFNSMILNQLNSIALKVPGWGENMNLSTTFNFWKPKKSAEKIVNEVLEKLQDKMTQDQEYWMENSFNPIVESQVRDMMSEFERDYHKFHIELNDIKTDILNINPKDLDGDEVSVGERIGAATVGLLLGNIGAAVYGSAVGFKSSLLKQIGIQFGIIFTMVLVGVTNPFILLGAIFSGGFIQYIMQSDKKVDTIKMKVCEHVKNEMTKNLDSNAKESASSIIQKINEYIEPVRIALNTDVETLREQVQKVLEEKKLGEAEVEKKVKELLDIEKDIKNADKRLQELVYEFVGVS